MSALLKRTLIFGGTCLTLAACGESAKVEPTSTTSSTTTSTDAATTTTTTAVVPTADAKKEAAKHYQLGLHEGELKNYGTAMKEAQEAVKLDPENIEYLYLRASLYAISRNNEAAIADANTIIKMNPKYKRAWEVRAACNKQMGNKKLAETDEHMIRTLK
ncbi:MAG: hypothetical protein IAF58_16265 [Leptolyngbya sp.]|nr:hypothetical protein [Candidatus Melainabacteria bacterium]